MGRRDAETSESPLPWAREASSVLAILLGLALVFSVFIPGEGLLGLFGHHVSSWLIAAFGGLAYPLTLACVIAPTAVLFQRLPRWGWDRAAGGLGIFLGTTVLLETSTRTGGRASGAAGQLGVALVESVAPWVGPLGTALVAVAALLIGVLVAFRLSLRLALEEGGQVLVRGLGAALRFVVDQLDRLRLWAFARRASASASSLRRTQPPPIPEPTPPAADATVSARPSAAPAPAKPTPRSGRKKASGSAITAPPADAELEPEDSPIDTERPDLAPEPEAITPRRAGVPKPTEPVIVERKNLPVKLEEAPPSPKPRAPDSFELPPLHLLDYEGDDASEIDGDDLKAKAVRLEEKLRTYGVEGTVTAIRPGPVVTTYEYEPAPGVKVSKIANLADDIAMSMQAVRVRIVAPIPGRGVVGIELPNERRENVYLKELIAHERFKKSKSLLTLAMGKDAEGEVQTRDLQQMPHLLIAGTTGSGKSVSINTMVLSILYKATPDQVKFIMVDPKMLELSLYNDIPHLLLPVVTDARKASRALQWAVGEMERRYQMMSDLKVRDVEGFNRRLARLRKARADRAAKGGEGPAELVDDKGKTLRDPWAGKELPDALPYIVVLIDEFADLMNVAPRDVESSVQRLAQMARAAGIHVLLATQRPSTDVITGVIKNNLPSRVSFRVASRHDSATVLNTPGAENLLGRGDSLFLSVASPLPQRIHGGFVSEEEVERVVEFWKAQAKPRYDASILKKPDDEEGGETPFGGEDADEHYDMAVQIVTETRRASISALQRRLRVGYNRAARMIEMMEQEGIVGPAMGPKGEREVLVPAPPDP
ncbi:MAG: DNA translocase FtsK 4TM domain-containing protein [Myxococcota bacterium]